MIDSYDPNANNSNTTFVYSDQLDEPVSEIEQSPAVPTNNIDEEDIIASLLRLNQENILPDLDEEPEWLHHLAA